MAPSSRLSLCPNRGMNMYYSPKQPISVLVIKLGYFLPSPLQVLPADLKRKKKSLLGSSIQSLGQKLPLKSAHTGLPLLNDNSKSWFKNGKQILFPGRLLAFIPIKLLRWHRAFPPLLSEYESDYCTGFFTQICALK